MNKIIFALIVVCIMIISTAATFAQNVGSGKKIIYIPIDNRPINLSQTVEVAEKLGYEVLVPPEEILGTGAGDDKLGNPEELWNWLDENAMYANAAVISTDAMLYGSLVGSRKHNLTNEIILERAKNFEKLHKDNPYLPIYALATIMRTPSYNWEATGAEAENIPETGFYGKYGEKIFKYTALKDREETEGLSKSQKAEMARLESEVPAAAMKNWFGRRAKNFDANKYFVDLTRAGVFQYLLIGCDDSAIFCQTNLESRHLKQYGEDLGKEKFIVMAGADELGMLMISRAVNNDLNYIPFVSIKYNIGKGADTVPAFCNEKISDSLESAIRSIGAMTVPNPKNADLVLAVNTFPSGRTIEASNKHNKNKPHSGIGPYMKFVKEYVKKGYPVGVVDISTANGSDNALMKRLRNENLQYKIRSYSGWNTATNSSGFLIGAGVLTNYMGEKDIYSLLTTRYFDEWAYQANIRTKINNGLIWTVPGEGNLWGLGTRQEGLEKLTSDLAAEFAAKNFFLPKGYTLKNIQARFKWSRTFEADITFDLDN